MSGRLGLDPGTKNAPGAYFTNSTNTGIYSPTPGQINVSAIANQIVNVSTSGVLVTGTVTSDDFNSTSDVKLKTNIETVENALDTTNQLRGVKFDWKSGGATSYGVIAQELEQVLPDLVTDGDTKTVNYNGIIGVLIEAVKELSAKVEELENR